MHTNRSRLARVAGALWLAAALPGAAQAAEYWLRAAATSVNSIPMWGYALCGSGSSAPATCAGAVSVPGPALLVPPGEGLVVHLENALPEPTSLVIAGQVKQEAMQPVWFEPAAVGTTYSGARPAGNTTARVRSFDREAAPGASATYTWALLRPGTYLYRSGTHPQVQVQMGLYGAMTKDAGAGKLAYSQGGSNVTYANQLTLLYSEIDPALHAAVAGGTFGNSGPGSTLNYRPTWFLINGKAYPDPSLNPLASAGALPAGQNLLLRFLNAGLLTHVPTILGQYWRVVAEDGNPVPFVGNARQQYTAFLPPGKTLDVLVQPDNPSATDPVRYPIFDSRYFDTSAGTPGGGMLARLEIGPAVAAAPVFDSAAPASATAGTTFQYQAHANASGGHPVQYALATPPAPPTGMSINAGTGLITWPAANVTAGSYPLTVRATDTVATLSTDQSFTLVVAGPSPNHAPLAGADTYTGVIHDAAAGAQVLAAPGLLANDTDADGNPLTAAKISECVLSGSTCGPVSNRITLNANGSFSLASSTAAGNLRMSYQALDNSGAPNNASVAANVTITMVANRAPTAAADAVTVARCTFRLGTGSACRTGAGFYQAPALNLAANDSDPDSQTLDSANQLPLAVARVRADAGGTGAGSTTSVQTASGGTVTISGGAVTYVPRYNFAGTDSFSYRVRDKLGKESGSTTTNTNNLGAGWAVVTVTVN